MTSAVLTTDELSKWGQDMHFAESESKPVGVNGNLMDIIRDNAPRIVGGLKLAGDIASGFTLNPFMMGYATFAITGRILLLVYGSKENQKKVAEEARQKGGDARAEPPDAISKVFHPREYPVEASAGLSVIAEGFETTYGASQFLNGKTGFSPLLVGAVSLWAYYNMLFGKEKKKDAPPEPGSRESLVFAQSESKPIGFVGRIQQMLKGNPILVSSLVGAVMSTVMLIGGIFEGGIPIAYAVAGGLFLTSNIVQGLFVRKNEFNIEGAQEEAGADGQKDKSSFQDRVAQKQSCNPWGMQPG